MGVGWSDTYRKGGGLTMNAATRKDIQSMIEVSI